MAPGSQGWGYLAPVICSMAVFSGSAQFALLATLGSGGGAAGAVMSAALINSRFIPMGIAVAGDLHCGRFRRALAGLAVVDGSWGAAHLGGGRFDRYLLFGATAIRWPAWVAGTSLGVVVSPDPDLLHRLGLDVLIPALFLALLFDEVRRKRINRLPALLGAAIAAGLIVFLPAGPALVGAALAALAALSFACKSFSPALFGGRTLPPRAQSVIALSAPALRPPWWWCCCCCWR
ncbi:AzlC family ABC transporter permease [Streptomyces cyaneofuscatus]|uniref:AzlC family ABC transporter permease n=1 Tax=Streptomyces cyaneofuscatus TaxID=66883 RepID=UPI0036587C4D